MQIRSISQNSQQTINPNFNAIKSVKCKGLYKKYPEYNKDLINTFKNNPKAMEFCKKYDVDIIFNAVDESGFVIDEVCSYCKIIFDNPAKSKLWGIFGSTKDSLYVSCTDSRLNLEDTLRATSYGLMDYLTPTRRNDIYSGKLDREIDLTERNIERELEAKQAKNKKTKEW